MLEQKPATTVEKTAFQDCNSNVQRCFAAQNETSDEIIYKEDGEPVVYRRRWFILLAYGLSYFAWSLSSNRYLPLVSEYALYFDTTNEVQAPPEYGMDFLMVSSSFYLLFFYPIAGQLVDNQGIKMMIVGSVGQALSAIWWFFSRDNFKSVIASRVLSSASGAFVTTTLLRITTQWFPQKERAIAVALATVLSELGSGAALIIGPLFITGERVINLDIRSCKEEFQEEFIKVYNETEVVPCNDEALVQFCCVAPIDIEQYNLVLAIFTSMVAIYTILVTRDSPPSPPSLTGSVKKGPAFSKAFFLMFKNKNYSQLCLTDFVATAPPQVFFATIARLVPQSVIDYSGITAAVALGLALPISIIIANYVSRTKKFYEVSAVSYAFGAVCWALATLCLALATPASEALLLVAAGAVLMALILWTVFGYELKLEYVYDREFNLEGFVVGADRAIFNLCSLIFVASIPPERFNHPQIPGRLMTFYVCLALAILAVVLVLTIQNKRDYRRTQHEAELEFEFESLVKDEEQSETLNRLEKNDRISSRNLLQRGISSFSANSRVSAGLAREDSSFSINRRSVGLDMISALRVSV